MPTYSPCQVTLVLVDQVSYINKGSEYYSSEMIWCWYFAGGTEPQEFSNEHLYCTNWFMKRVFLSYKGDNAAQTRI